MNKAALHITNQPLVAFINERMMPEGVITLQVSATKRVIDVDFLVVNCRSTFNAIMVEVGFILCKHLSPLYIR